MQCNINSYSNSLRNIALTALALPLQAGAILRNEKGSQLRLAVAAVPAMAPLSIWMV